MGVSPVLSVFLFALLASAVSGGHDHHKDIHWLDILAHMGWFKNQTDGLSTVESVSERTDANKDSHHFESTPEPQLQNSELSTDYTSTAILQNGDNYINDDYYYYRPNYALIISLPIVGLVILIACCVGICKCCCGNKHSQGMVLLQQPNAVHPPPVSTQIIVQQPNYPQGQPSYPPGQPTYPPGQPAPPPPYPMQQPVQNYEQQQWSPHQPLQQQWEAHQTQDPQYPKQGYDNPNFNPTAPPPYPQGKY